MHENGAKRENEREDKKSRRRKVKRSEQRVNE
jgi:hypothetical protein